ncbi:hypothetical protein H7171_04315 [Candidatus Saccharibacteria bacterium]|nr:hypothetical protein [Candidatus Saccharibacteria bacterium]
MKTAHPETTQSISNLLATTEMYGTPHAACMAMMMQASGITEELPDIQHIASFARVDRFRPVTTVLGAACSFNDIGFDVRFVGAPDTEMLNEQPRAMHEWQQILESRTRTSFSSVAPIEADVVKLLAPGSRTPWLTMLYVNPGALEQSFDGVHPTLVQNIAADHAKVVVSDPGSEHHEGQTYRSILLARALGSSTLHNGAISLLAIRRRTSADERVVIRNTQPAGAKYN